MAFDEMQQVHVTGDHEFCLVEKKKTKNMLKISLESRGNSAKYIFVSIDDEKIKTIGDMRPILQKKGNTRVGEEYDFELFDKYFVRLKRRFKILSSFNKG